MNSLPRQRKVPKFLPRQRIISRGLLYEPRLKCVRQPRRGLRAFCPGLYLKPGQMGWPLYIWLQPPPLPPISLIFFMVGGGVGVLVFFSPYALEVFGEMPVRAMPLEFTQDKHDMRCPSHT